VLRIISYCVVLVLLPSFIHAASASRELVHLLSQYHTMTAHFQQQLLNGKGHVVRETSGLMTIKRPGKFRWETRKADKQIIVAKANTVWIYDVALEQAVRRHVKKSQRYSPVYLLTQSVRELPYAYSIHLIRTNKREKMFRLFPRYHNDNVQAIELLFSKNKLTYIAVLDGLGQRIHFHFKNIKLNPFVSDKVFTLHLPEWVDVITQ